jgi:CelD/BcsL family acetyltransferase involved in cellulose biosynthesis
VQLVKVRDDAQWDALLETQPDATLYHTMGWLRLQEQHGSLTLFPLVIMQDGQPVGLFPVFLTRRGPFRVCSSPRGVDTQYMGPLAKRPLLPEILDCYETWAEQQGIDFTTVTFSHEIDHRVAVDRGYTCETQRTYLLDLTPGQDALLKQSHQECRNQVRKARRLGVTVTECDLRPHLDLYLGLSAKVFARSNRRTSLTRAFVEAMLKSLSETGRLVSLRAEVGRKIVGMDIAGHYGGRLYALDIASDDAFRGHCVNRLMTWSLVAWGCEHGMNVMDFVGANTPSIASHKVSYGGVLTAYTNVKRTHTLAGRAAVWFHRYTVQTIRNLTFARSQKGQLQR